MKFIPYSELRIRFDAWFNLHHPPLNLFNKIYLSSEAFRCLDIEQYNLAFLSWLDAEVENGHMNRSILGAYFEPEGK